MIPVITWSVVGTETMHTSWWEAEAVVAPTTRVPARLASFTRQRSERAVAHATHQRGALPLDGCGHNLGVGLQVAGAASAFRRGAFTAVETRWLIATAYVRRTVRTGDKHGRRHHGGFVFLRRASRGRARRAARKGHARGAKQRGCLIGAQCCTVRLLCLNWYRQASDSRVSWGHSVGHQYGDRGGLSGGACTCVTWQ